MYITYFLYKVVDMLSRFDNIDVIE